MLHRIREILNDYHCYRPRLKSIEGRFS